MPRSTFKGSHADGRTKLITIRLPAYTKHMLQKVATENERTMSEELFRRIVHSLEITDAANEIAARRDIQSGDEDDSVTISEEIFTKLMKAVFPRRTLQTATEAARDNGLSLPDEVMRRVVCKLEDG